MPKVQAAVNNIMGKSEPSKKNVAEIAKEVISGKWGNGSERKQRLEAAAIIMPKCRQRSTKC